MRRVIRQSVLGCARRMGYRITRIPHKPAIGKHCSVVAYCENAEVGPSNIETKYDNVKKGLPFEFPDIVNLNNAVARLAKGAKRICEFGCGTGTFATAAALEPGVFVVASEFDYATYEWVRANKQRPNIQYVHGPVAAEAGPFDVLVAVEVIEHVSEYVKFLRACQATAPRALITTPNRSRGEQYYHSGPPPYFKHVREWTAGEFYWVMRSFYQTVTLYALTSDTQPTYTEVDVDTTMSPLVADCREPIS